MQKLFIVLLIAVLPVVVSAEPLVVKKENKTEITMTALDAVKMAGDLIERGDIEHAEQILTKMPQTKSLSVEIERWFLLGQIAQRRGDYEAAINIYKKILDDQPDLARIRFELDFVI